MRSNHERREPEREERIGEMEKYIGERRERNNEEGEEETRGNIVAQINSENWPGRVFTV